METWRRFLRLSGYERTVVLEAAAGLAATWLGLRLGGFRRWQRALGWLAPTAVSDSIAAGADAVERAREIARLEAAAARNLAWRANCLEHSLVLWWLLRRRGISAEVRIGARKEANRFEAHAWAELDGTVLNDADEEHAHFVPFDGPVAALETQTH